MAKTKKSLGQKQFQHWKKHGFDSTLREALNWKEEEYWNGMMWYPWPVLLIISCQMNIQKKVLFFYIW